CKHKIGCTAKHRETPYRHPTSLAGRSPGRSGCREFVQLLVLLATSAFAAAPVMLFLLPTRDTWGKSPPFLTHEGVNRLRLIKIGGWVRQRLEAISLHLGSSYPGEPRWLLLAGWPGHS